MKGHKPGRSKSSQTTIGVTGSKSSGKRMKALEQAAGFARARDFARAERIYVELIGENARDPDANLQLALLYRQAGRNDMALARLHNLDATEISNALSCNLIGILWHQCGQPKRAIPFLERAVARRPASVEFRFNLGLALRDLGLPQRALECFTANLQVEQDHVPSLLQSAMVLRDIDRLHDALAAFQHAAELEPANADIFSYLALTHIDLSHIDEAIRCWERVLELAPANSVAYLRLSHLRRGDHNIAAMEKMYAGTLKSVDRINIAFGLGKALEDVGDYDRAFHYLSEGNRLKRQQFKYSIDEWRMFFEKLKSIFDAEFVRGFPCAGSEDDTPIFVLGMPRSGSSLVEQILASHPDVFGAGELKALPAICAEGARRRSQPFPEYLRYLVDADWRELCAEYLAVLRSKSPSARRITDKMPQNFRFVGAIGIMLPRAKIIHCYRSPLDNCWSIYKNLFAEGHPYSYDLDELGKFYSYYRALMEHWNAVLPGFIYNLAYERLVADPRVEIAGLLSFCDLPFDQRCVDFHQCERAVHTMSAAQVKRPINADSIESWSRFEKYLEPLVRGLSLEGGCGHSFYRR